MNPLALVTWRSALDDRGWPARRPHREHRALIAAQAWHRDGEPRRLPGEPRRRPRPRPSP
jgi:hypothetical protein